MQIGPKIDCLNESSLPIFQDQFFNKSEQETPISSTFSNGLTCENRVTFKVSPKIDLKQTSGTLKSMLTLPKKPSMYSHLQNANLVKKAIRRLRKASVFMSKLRKAHYQIIDDPVHEHKSYNNRTSSSSQVCSSEFLSFRINFSCFSNLHICVAEFGKP